MAEIDIDNLKPLSLVKKFVGSGRYKKKYKFMLHC